MLKKLLYTSASKSILIIRILVGTVFLSEGLQKFLFPTLRGAGRFEKIGLPAPGFLAPFVGTFEILCGILLLLGLFTRYAGIILLIVILVAISTTKVDIFMDKGFWEMLHASRTDWSMFLGSIFLIINGGGSWSLDKKWFS